MTPPARRHRPWYCRATNQHLRATSGWRQASRETRQHLISGSDHATKLATWTMCCAGNRSSFISGSEQATKLATIKAQKPVLLLDCCVAELALYIREMLPHRTEDKQHPVLHFEYADGDDPPKGLPFNADAGEIEPEPECGRSPELLKGLELPETATRSICAALKAQS